MRALALVASLAWLPAAGCSSHQPTRCEHVCGREAACGRELKLEVELSECVDACTALDRDPGYQPAVDRHVRCVDGASDCRAVLACQ